MVRYLRSQGRPFWELKLCWGEWHSTLPHSHREWSLGWVESGTCLVGVAGGWTRVDAPALVWFSPETVHQCRPLVADAWRFRMVYWRAPGAPHQWGARPLVPGELGEWVAFFEALERGQARRVPAELAARGFGTDEPGQAVRIPSLGPGARPDRAYKRLHGLAPTQHRTLLKLRQGQELLRQGLSPSQAALESGFYDQAQFTRGFRALTGTTPRRFVGP